MRNGIKVNFAQRFKPASIDFSALVTGFDAVAQNGLINIGTRQGSDALDDLRGTSLFSAATVGQLVDAGERDHATALAAERTRFSLRNQEDIEDITDPAEQISEVGLEVSEVDLMQIVFNAYFININEEVVGSPLVEIL
jgi:hypothetical protein